MASFAARPLPRSSDCAATGRTHQRRADPASPSAPGSTSATTVSATKSAPSASTAFEGPAPASSAQERKGSTARPRVPEAAPQTARSSRKRAMPASSRTAAWRSAISAAGAGVASQLASVSSPGPVSAALTSWKRDAGPKTSRSPA